MPTTNKLLIGAGAGVCLAILKAIKAGFFLTGGSTVLLTGCLLSLSYVIVSAIFAAILSETDRIKLFRQGFLAPSVLMAIIESGLPTGSQGAAPSFPPDIPTIGSSTTRPVNERLLEFVFPVAYADSLRPNEPVSISGKGVLKLKREDLEPTISGSLSYLLKYNAEPVNSSLIVFGKVADTAKGREIVERLALLELGPNLGEIRLIQPDGKNEVYLSVGSVTSRAQALERLNSLGEFPTPDSCSADLLRDIDLLRKAQVVDARVFFGTN